MAEPSDTDHVLVTAERARVEFGELVAVRDLTFQLQAGNLLGLIGPNGAGKTTLLRAIAGLQPLTAGRIRVMDRDVRPGAIQVQRHIGFASDTPPAYEDLTVRDFLRFIGMGYGLGRRTSQERIDFWLEQVWLTGKADQKIKDLSRGMRQRVGIARTLMPNPNVVLLDEPAAGLDPAGRVQFRELLCSLRDQSKALIVSSHILADLNEYCTHIAIMAQGSIIQFGSVQEISNGGDGQRCRYTIALARPIANLVEKLVQIDGLTDPNVNRDRAEFEYHSNRAAAAELIAILVKMGIPIASFAPNASDLEEAYLRTGIQQVD